MSSQLILVTGANGFLGAHVIDQLVKKGHRVRGTVRQGKLAKNQEIYNKTYGSAVEIVAVDDLIKGDFTSVLQGVDAVIHVASPLAGRATPEATIDSAVLGTTNVLRQAVDAGIKRISVMSSIVAAKDFAGPAGSKITENDWNPATREQALANRDAMFVYSASKALAEKAVWEIVDKHPDVNVTAVNGTFFVGPWAPAFLITPGDVNGLSTNILIYKALLPGSKSTTTSFGYVDVRDVAAALVAGIDTPGKSRNLITGPWFELKDAVDYIGSLHPELDLPNIVPTGQTESTIDVGPTLRRLGLTLHPWKESVKSAVEAVLQVEKDWIAQGINVDAEGGLGATARRA